MILFLFITCLVLKLYKCINIGKSIILVSRLSKLLEFIFSPFIGVNLVPVNISENNISLLLQDNWKKSILINNV